ncbi:hypothetical protein B0H13DRAFT_1891743 [Mycena leptocephala]|nr:hypothetical protein B0H13DRAFT_1891743 [Mycena leptocephala]
MAEIAAGFVGAAATVGAAGLTAESGFTGRHESSHRQEIMETRRNTDDFLANLRSGEVTPDEESDFLSARDEAIRGGSEYHDSIQSYKNTSWFNLPTKLRKRKEVRTKKRLTQQSNHSLRSLNEYVSGVLTNKKSIYSGSDRSSICASAGSPPGSNLAVDDIQCWANTVQNTASEAQYMTESWFESTVEDPSFEDASSHPVSPGQEVSTSRDVADFSQIEASTDPIKVIRRQRRTRLLEVLPARGSNRRAHSPQREQDWTHHRKQCHKAPQDVSGRLIIPHNPL